MSYWLLLFKARYKQGIQPSGMGVPSMHDKAPLILKQLGKKGNELCSYNVIVLINGRERSQFTTSRKLSQGCPLSPFLFLIYVEGFSALI